MHRTGYHQGRRHALAPAAALLALCLLAGGAQAYLTPVDDVALAAGADEIVRGEITGVSSRWTDDGAGIVTTATIRVLDRAKGQGAGSLELTVPGGTVGNVSLWVEDQPELASGTEAFVFVKYTPSGQARVYGGADGVVPVVKGRVHGHGRAKGGGVFADAYGQYIAALASGRPAPAPARSPAPRASGSASTPVIASVSPASASAGTGTEITITGSGFGSRPSRDSVADVGFTYRYTGSGIVPIWASGYPTFDRNPDEIVSWSDSRIVVRVPAGITPDGYGGSASSGFLWVLSDENVPGVGTPFTVTFGDGGANWTGPCTFQVNPEGLTPEMVAAIVRSSATWNGALPATAPQFLYGGSTSETTEFLERDGVNLVSLGTDFDFVWSPAALAQTMAWRESGVISEVDLLFNPAYAWTDADAAGETWNMEQVSLHEFGHWLRLTDLYGWVPGYPSDLGEVMFGYGAEWLGNKNRVSLAPDDVAGIRWMYPRSGTVPPTPPGPRPYPGPHVVPGTVEAEDFDAGGEGVAYHDTEPANLGGAYRPAEGVDIESGGGVTNVGWVRSGEWLNYTVNATAPRNVVLRLRAANPDPATKRIALSVGGAPAGTIEVPSTGSFESYGLALSAPFGLSPGATMLRLSFDGAERVNLDRLEIVSADLSDPGLPKPTPTPVPTTPTPTPGPALLIDAPGSYVLDRDLAGAWNGVVITSSDVVLDGNGHTVTGPGAMPVYGAGWGVAVLGTQDGVLSNVTVRNLSPRGWNQGLRVERTTGATVESVVAEECTTGGYLVYAETTTLSDSTFRDCTGAGLSVDFRAGGTVDRCRAVNNSVGITASSVGTVASPLRVRGSDVAGNGGAGVVVMDGGYLAGIEDCTLSDNDGSGIHVDMSDADPESSWPGGGTIARNRIVRNAGAGILVVDWPGLEVRGNRVEENAAGLRVWGAAAPRVWDNLFNNTVALDLADAIVTPALNATRSAGPNIVGGPSIGGNFWGAPDGAGFSQTHADSDGDGFVDEPFVDPGGAVDHLPLAPAPAVAAVPGGTALPADTDGDGRFDDVNGNGRADFADVVLYFDRMDWIAANEPLALFDYNANGRVDFADVVWLFDRL